MDDGARSSGLIQAIKDDDESKIISILSQKSVNLDEQDGQGWTGLMLAAKHNDVDTIQSLVKKRANTSIKNDLDQTALDVARQFKSRASLNILKSQKRLTSVEFPMINYFSHVPLNRHAEKRKDHSWLNTMMRKPTSKYVLFSNLKPLAKKMEGQKKYHLSILSYSQLESVLGAGTCSLKNVIFLGIEGDCFEQNSDSSHFLEEDGCNKGSVWFAVDVGQIDMASDKFLNTFPGTEYLSPRPGFLQVHVEDATILAQARPILEWHQYNRFCPRCGSTVNMEDGGYKQACSNSQCASNKGVLNVSYPRLDPVSIMLVVSQDGTRCLLGRKPVFPKGMYSCLAGYMEPGESIEDAVRREVLEESGVDVDLVEYHSSQFWPYPTQLMIGCVAHAITEDITVDKEELEDATWFKLDKIRQASNTGPGSDLWLPPRQAIARQLIDHWMEMGSSHL